MKKNQKVKKVSRKSTPPLIKSVMRLELKHLDPICQEVLRMSLKIKYGDSVKKFEISVNL